MKIKREPSKLQKLAKRGHRGYPIATVAFYGPDADHASKVAVGIVPRDDGEVTQLRRFTSTSADIRKDPAVGADILEFIREAGAKTVVVTPGIIGCPHEEGTDYPEGEVCPKCTFWQSRDRWTGELLQEN